jgi:phage baseplate assembly protein W
MMATNLYKGFSTRDWQDRQNFGMRDLELVKRDLLNHIFTVKGERVMMPNFGTRIPLLAFEPNDEQTRAIVEADLTEVFNYDPRVNLIGLTVSSLPDNNAILALADLLYVEFQVRDELRIEVPTQ